MFLELEIGVSTGCGKDPDLMSEVRPRWWMIDQSASSVD